MGQVVYNPSNDLIRQIGGMAKRLTHVERGNGAANPTMIRYLNEGTLPTSVWTLIGGLATGNEPAHVSSVDPATFASGVWTLNYTGLYEFDWLYGFLTGGATGNERSIYMQFNNSSGLPGTSPTDYRDVGSMVAAASGYTHDQLHTKFYAEAGEFFRLFVYQNSGASITVGGNISGAYHSNLILEYKGSW